MAKLKDTKTSFYQLGKLVESAGGKKAESLYPEVTVSMSFAHSESITFSDEPKHFDWEQYADAFAAFYERKKKDPNNVWCFVVSRASYSSGFWVERNSRPDPNIRIFRSLAAVKAYEMFVRSLDEEGDLPNIVWETFDFQGGFIEDDKGCLATNLTKAGKNVSSNKPVRQSPASKLKAAPVEKKRKIILED